jgi:hypothetical protein
LRVVFPAPPPFYPKEQLYFVETMDGKMYAVIQQDIESARSEVLVALMDLMEE